MSIEASSLSRALSATEASTERTPLKPRTLDDLGERRILSEIIPHYATGVGDDCATLPVSNGFIVVTMDPVPPPAAHIIGGDPNPYWAGWLLVTINASDIAAAGGKPKAFLSSLDMPRETPIEDFEALLAGVRDGCRANGLDYVGGNIREAASFAATGTGLGECVGYRPLARGDAQPGDVVLCIGQGGQFWCDALAARAALPLDKDASPLFRPVSQAPMMWRLAERGLVRASMDTSDGLSPTLVEIARASNVHLRIEVDALLGHRDHGGFFSEAPRCWFGWGDWTVVTTAPRSSVGDIQRLAADAGSAATEIGVVEQGQGVSLHAGGASCAANGPDSERFVSASWFSSGIDGYIQRLLAMDMPNRRRDP